MKKLFLYIFIVSNTFIMYSQSPYSFYGVGVNTFKGTMDNRSMGGLNVYSDSIHLNLTNPASYSELELVNYSVGVNYNKYNFKTDNSNESASGGNINYLAVGIPTKLFNFGFGIIPQSSVEYFLTSTDEIAVPERVDRYEGEGGVNTAFLTFGFKLFKRIGLGLTANYEFGNLRHTASRFLKDIELSTRLENNSSLSGLNFVYSTLIKEKISKKLTLQATYIFKPESKLSSINTQRIGTIPVSGGFGGDFQDIDLNALNLEKTKIVIPKSNTFGIGVGEETKWFIGADYTTVDGGGLDNKLFKLENVEFKKASKIAFGGFWIPKHDSFTSYFSRIVYRAGIRFEETGLHIQNQAINEFGINFGFGLPFQGFSNLNLGFEAGRRGTKNAGLIQEDFFNIRLGISLNDRWFVKNKYN